jgi:hypothetical protein
MGNIDFAVRFEEWKEETGENLCDFCEMEQTRYFCDLLSIGYCKKCMKEQIEEYKKYQLKMME